MHSRNWWVLILAISGCTGEKSGKGGGRRKKVAKLPVNCDTNLEPNRTADPEIEKQQSEVRQVHKHLTEYLRNGRTMLSTVTIHGILQVTPT